jgi:hypothetical protein
LLCLSQSRTWITNKYADVDGIVQGVDPGFQARRGALTFFWGYFVWKITILRQKINFFQLWREARTFLGCFVWKITILRQQIIFFPILGGARAGSAPPPWIRPC